MPGNSWFVTICLKYWLVALVLIRRYYGWLSFSRGKVGLPGYSPRLQMNRSMVFLLVWCVGSANAETQIAANIYGGSSLYGDDGPMIRTFKETGAAAVDLMERVTQAQGMTMNVPFHGIAQGDDQINPGGGMVVHGHNQDVLMQVAGERNFWIFRPNPHDLPRPESLRIFAHASDTVEALLLQIANH